MVYSDSYTGDWKDGNRHGHGVYKSADGVETNQVYEDGDQSDLDQKSVEKKQLNSLRSTRFHSK